MSALTLEAAGDRLTFLCQSSHVCLTFDRWRADRDQLSAEVTITTSAPGYQSHLTAGRLNLTSLPTRTQWAKRLADLYAEADWTALLEEACYRAIQQYRKGDPVSRLAPAPVSAGPSWRVQPLLYEQLPTVIFGPGGSRKSFLGLWLALLVENGVALEGAVRAVLGRTLYLDYEADQATAEYRLGRFVDGNPALAPACPSYRRMKQPLAADLPVLSASIVEQGIVFLIVDSLAMACGGKDLSDPSTAVSYFSALRQLPCTSLSIAHVPKNTENPMIYGSVFFTNIARMTWEIKCQTDEDTGSSTIGLFNRKANERRHRPMGLQFAHDAQSEAITVSPATLTDDEAFLDASPVAVQISHYLTDGAKSAARLALLLGKPVDTVLKTLHRGEAKGCYLALGAGRGTEWVLPP